jgi:hypothetical protein
MSDGSTVVAVVHSPRPPFLVCDTGTSDFPASRWITPLSCSPRSRRRLFRGRTEITESRSLESSGGLPSSSSSRALGRRRILRILPEPLESPRERLLKSYCFTPAPESAPGQRLRQTLRDRNRARHPRPWPPDMDAVWQIKKAPLPEPTVRRLRELLAIHAPRGRIDYRSLEEMATRMGFPPDAKMQFLFSRFANRATGSIDLLSALRLLFPQTDPSTLPSVLEQLGEPADKTAQKNDWRQHYDAAGLSDLMALFRLYAQQPGGDDPDDTLRTEHQHNSSKISPGRIRASRRLTRPGLATHQRSTQPQTEIAQGPAIWWAQVRACFPKSEVPDDWIDELFRDGDNGRLTLDRFAMAMKPVLVRPQERLPTVPLHN